MSGLNAAIKAARNQRQLAKLIGTWPQTVNRWVVRYGGVVPAEWVLPIFRATGVTPHELRPDLHPTPASGIPDQNTANTQKESD
ncbi:YdaS family helix-turn-helix protein [Buttiauxella selenatireducens]|uniref:YdaS family helix-turn-helix protein n=1 Tax=Buttiauxella selenatireducens TaxID=3073902 RepID=A0ABY9SHR7_9ENTR|nr:YdaS family helix-turn-helix protein [Buttiauxella sp. R73]WMY76410.1 YdaS family helix-turn-helix protein [Buttiauxella sp. R73]